MTKDGSSESEAAYVEVVMYDDHDEMEAQKSASKTKVLQPATIATRRRMLAAAALFVAGVVLVAFHGSPPCHGDHHHGTMMQQKNQNHQQFGHFDNVPQFSPEETWTAPDDSPDSTSADGNANESSDDSSDDESWIKKIKTWVTDSSDDSSDDSPDAPSPDGTGDESSDDSSDDESWIKKFKAWVMDSSDDSSDDSPDAPSASTAMEKESVTYHIVQHLSTSQTAPALDFDENLHVFLFQPGETTTESEEETTKP
jgi:hypothetical protein